MSRPNISFDDTAIAFSYKPTSELKKANFIFSLVSHPWISALATGSLKLALNLRLPIEGVVRKTAFDHFCGGVTIEDSEKAVERLGKHNVGTILDYSVEGEKSEQGFDKTKKELLLTIEKAATSKDIPFSVFKVTGLAAFDLLEKIQKRVKMSNDEINAFKRAKDRVTEICERAHTLGVRVLIDAEETWIQEPIDNMAYEMMARFNKQKAIIFNTYQLYRTDTLANLKSSFSDAVRDNYFLGAKLVRGAYMEKERARAEAHGYESPIQPDKDSSDKAFNDALQFCMEHVDRISFMCGSHNEYSNLLLTELMNRNGISKNDERIWFAQLYGMSDNISFNLAKAGYNVAKYVPYGPVKAVMPYLLRRAAENTSVAGQSSRELLLIRKELRRRRNGD
ncbi:MAG TPA: proline dehydrogenase family protein [Chryseosolibacter sp.]|nr:proline dehydrogenase family protein [Chryseosolibacter sp.]